MTRQIVKVQLPIGGNQAILLYDESRELFVIVDDPEDFASISEVQGGELKAYWYADVDYEAKTFKLIERAPEQEW